MTAIFISHSSADNAAADKMKAWLESKGHTSLFLDFDPEAGIKASSDWEQMLQQKLRQCQAVIALLTPHWLASKGCFVELAQARAGGKAIFPVKIQDCQAGGVFSDIQPIDLTTQPEEGYRRLEIGLKNCGLDPLNVFAWNPNRPPYPGLLAFQEADAALFFGRSEEILKALETLETLRRQGRDATRFVLLLGAPGSGKSSLARAGIIPLLNTQPAAWLPVPPFRPQEEPLEELAVALSTAFKKHGNPRAWEELRTELHTAAAQDPVDGGALLSLVHDLAMAAQQPEATVLLTLDQTEELFGYSRPEAATRFLRLLRAALETADRGLLALATMHSDFLGKFQNHPALQDGEYAHHFRYQPVLVDPMPLRNFPRIIQDPARLAGLQLEKGLVEAMVRDTDTQNALPLLAFTLRRLYERYGQDGRLTIGEYETLGGLKGAIREEAQQLLTEANPSPEELEALHAAFIPAMVRIDAEGNYARRRARLIDMPPRAVPLLRRCVDARLLVTDQDKEGREIIELAHEVLLRTWPQLTTWLAEDQDKLRLLESLQQAAEEWDKGGRRTDLLSHRDSRLQDAVALLANPRFGVANASVERAYLDACSVAQHARKTAEKAAEQEWRIRDTKRIAQHTMIGLVVALVLALVAIWLYEDALTKRQIAERAAQVAEAQRLAAYSGASLEKDLPQQAGLLAVEAIRATKQDGSVVPAEQALRDALDKLPGLGLGGHKGGITAVAIDPQGHWLVTGSLDGTARLWDLQAPDPGQTARVLRGHENVITAVAFDPQGRWLVTGSGDRTARLWDLQAPDPSQAVRVLRGHEGEITAVAFDPQGRWLVTGSRDKTARRWDLQAADPNQTVRVLHGHEGEITAVAFDPQGRWLVTGSRDKTARWWDLQAADPNQTARELLGHEDGIRVVALDPQSHWLVTGNLDGTARRWDLQATDPSQTAHVLRGHEGEITAMAIDPQGHWLVTSSLDKTALWDLQAADPSQTVRELRGHKDVIRAVAFDPQGRWLVTGSDDNTARLWDLQAADPSQTARVLRGHEGEIRAVAFDPKGRWLVTGSQDKTARLWDLQATADLGQTVCVLRGHKNAIRAVAFDPQGRWLVTGSGDKTARLWDLQAAADLGQTIPVLSGHEDEITAVALDPQGRWLVTSSLDKTALWDLQAVDPSQTARVLLGHEDGVRAVALGPQGRWLVTGSRDGTTRLWDLQAAAPSQTVRVLHGHEGSINAVALDPQGRWLVTSSLDKTALWDLQAADPSQTARVLLGHEGWIEAVALDSQGRWLVTGSHDGTGRRWDLQAADPSQTARVLRGHEGSINAVALDPQGRWLVTGSEDKTARLWNLQAADPSQTARVLRGHENVIRAVALDPQGRWLVTGSDDNTARLWELRLDVLLDRTRRAIGRNLTVAEWEQYFPGKPYCPTFPELPVPTGANVGENCPKPVAKQAVVSAPTVCKVVGELKEVVPEPPKKPSQPAEVVAPPSPVTAGGGERGQPPTTAPPAPTPGIPPKATVENKVKPAPPVSKPTSPPSPPTPRRVQPPPIRPPAPPRPEEEKPQPPKPPKPPPRPPKPPREEKPPPGWQIKKNE